jgi:hypothetical protein
MPTESDETESAASESTETVTTLRADVAQLVDEHWPLFGDEWQIRRAREQREAFKITLATIIK